MTRTPTARDLTLDQILERQRQAFLADPQPGAKIRRDRILRLKRLVLDNAADLTEAMREDYGSRPETFSTLTDIASSNRSDTPPRGSSASSDRGTSRCTSRSCPPVPPSAPATG